MMPRNRKALLTVLVVLGLLAWQHFYPETYNNPPSVPADDAVTAVETAWQAKQSGLWITTEGRIIRLLPDDNDGSRHQRFIIDVGNGHTLLVSHNIDLAGRVPAETGAVLTLRGRYEWNERGGVMHWTHHDPKGYEQGGWIELAGKRYR